MIVTVKSIEFDSLTLRCVEFVRRVRGKRFQCLLWDGADRYGIRRKVIEVLYAIDD